MHTVAVVSEACAITSLIYSLSGISSATSGHSKILYNTKPHRFYLGVSAYIAFLSLYYALLLV